MENIDGASRAARIPYDLQKPGVIGPDTGYGTFRAGMDYRNILKELQSGRAVAAEGSFATAVSFYSWLKKRIISRNPVSDYYSSRNTREIISEVTGKILIRVRDHRIDLLRAPDIPWLKTFYPERRDFLIPLPEILGMNGAWQWFKQGISYPVIGKSLHPFYGVYFPTRTEHLDLFDRWLSDNSGEFESALDIGTGCGILAFIMAKHGIQNIHATDINPNAVYSASMDCARLYTGNRIEIERASLFGSLEEFGGLAVFNPPWIPGVCRNMIDRGIYYEKGFFSDFFNDAQKRMARGSTLAIIFSNYAIEAGITEMNPVEKEAGSGNNFSVVDKITEKVTERSSRRSRSWVNSIREKEETELWILKKQG